MPFPFFGLSPSFLAGLLIHAHYEGLRLPTPDFFGAMGLYFLLNIPIIIFVAAMTVGLFRKSRWCAVALFVYGVITFLCSLPVAFGLFGISSLIIAALTIIIYSGMLDTFRYRRMEQNKKTLEITE
jgi:hypothetical protein